MERSLCCWAVSRPPNRLASRRKGRKGQKRTQIALNVVASLMPNTGSHARCTRTRTSLIWCPFRPLCPFRPSRPFPTVPSNESLRLLQLPTNKRGARFRRNATGPIPVCGGLHPTEPTGRRWAAGRGSRPIASAMPGLVPVHAIANGVHFHRAQAVRRRGGEPIAVPPLRSRNKST